MQDKMSRALLPQNPYIINRKQCFLPSLDSPQYGLPPLPHFLWFFKISTLCKQGVRGGTQGYVGKHLPVQSQ